MNGYYEFKTRAGAFRIVPRANLWLAMFEDENLGPYNSPQAALDDLSGGHTDWPSCGDPSELGLPDDLSDWPFIRARR
jgi:hypothetical protein